MAWFQTANLENIQYKNDKNFKNFITCWFTETHNKLGFNVVLVLVAPESITNNNLVFVKDIYKKKYC